MTPLKIAWLTQYPLYTVEDRVAWVRKRPLHPSSWIVNLAKALGQRRDIELHLITLCPWVRGDQTITHPDGYTLHVLDSGIPLLHRGFPAYAPLDVLTGFRMERRKLVARLGPLHPDVVHAHGTEYVYGLAAMDADYPWVVSLQGIIGNYVQTNPCLRFRLVAPLEAKVLNQATFIGGRTHCDKGYAAKVNPQAIILDLPEAVNECFFDGSWRDPGNQRILFVGGGERRKGLHHLIDALGRLSGQQPDLILEVCGHVSLQQQNVFRAQAETHGVALRFLGFKSAQDIAVLHRECCLFVMPSENENSPNALAEAMASGMPVVAYDTGGISSMVDQDVSGLLVPFGDKERLAAAIAHVLQSPECRDRLGRNARVRAERNRAAHVAEVTVQAYRRILKEWPANRKNPPSIRERSRL